MIAKAEGAVEHTKRLRFKPISSVQSFDSKTEEETSRTLDKQTGKEQKRKGRSLNT